jgi:hypothetical protein
MANGGGGGGAGAKYIKGIAEFKPLFSKCRDGRPGPPEIVIHCMKKIKGSWAVTGII